MERYSLLLDVNLINMDGSNSNETERLLMILKINPEPNEKPGMNVLDLTKELLSGDIISFFW